MVPASSVADADVITTLIGLGILEAVRPGGEGSGEPAEAPAFRAEDTTALRAAAVQVMEGEALGGGGRGSMGRAAVSPGIDEVGACGGVYRDRLSLIPCSSVDSIGLLSGVIVDEARSRRDAVRRKKVRAIKRSIKPSQCLGADGIELPLDDRCGQVASVVGRTTGGRRRMAGKWVFWYFPGAYTLPSILRTLVDPI